MGKKKFKPPQGQQQKESTEPTQPQHEHPKPSSSQQPQRGGQGPAASGDIPRGGPKQQEGVKSKQKGQYQQTQLHQELQKMAVAGGSQKEQEETPWRKQQQLPTIQQQLPTTQQQLPTTQQQQPGGRPGYPTAGSQQARVVSPPQRHGFPSGPQGFPPGPQGFPRGPQGFPPGPQGFPPGPQGFPHGPRGFPPGPQGFPSGSQGNLQGVAWQKAPVQQQTPPVGQALPPFSQQQQPIPQLSTHPPQGTPKPSAQPQVAPDGTKKRRGRQSKEPSAEPVQKVAAPAKEAPSKPKQGEPAKAIPPVQKGESESKQAGKATTPQKQRQESPPLDFIVPLRKQLKSGGTKGRKILIETNHLALVLKNLKPAIHYDVAIDPDKPKKLLRLVMEQFRRQNYPNRYPAFDGVKNLYSSSMLPFGQQVSGEITIQEDDRDKTFKVTVKYATEVDLTSLSRYFESAASGNTHMVTPQEAIQCLDIVLRNAPSLHCIPVGRSFFTKPERTMNLGDGMEMYHGVYQSAILGWKPFLNVDVSHKAFPKVMSVLDLIQELCGEQYRITTDDLQRQNFELVNGYMKTLKVQYQIPTQPSSKRVMRVNQLDKPAKDARFKSDNNIEMSVADYFSRVKNCPLKYPHLPCLWVGSKQRETRILLPPEFCTILEGQVTNRRMTANQTSNMIRIATTSTSERKQKIMSSIRAANFSRDNCCREFGISINEDFTKVQARVLDPPQLKYASDRPVQPQKGVWRADRFTTTGKLENWSIVCVDDRTRPQVLQEFADTMIQQGRPLGMAISRPEVKSIRLMRGKEKATLEQEFSKLKQNNLILVVIPEFPKEVYNYVKQAAELTVGVVTQCVKGKNVFRPKPSTLGNILLKVNAKLNGLNHGLAKLPACLHRPCMIMGADVTHPSPESRGTVPSVAAVTASHDRNAFKYNITWRLQKSTQEIITDLANIVREHLMYFYKTNRVKPESIIFFRDGVSEGQFEIVVNSEVQAVRRACQMLEPSGTYKPKLTFLVVQKRHHTRFFPTNPRDSEDRNCNVPAGTVVDTEITHPTALDFYLVSHASIQGVARPTKYRKLWDDNDMQEDELEELTYHLCHLFTRCTRSVSYPAPTYYAHLAAARAKVYCETKNLNMDNLEVEQSRLQIKTEVIKDFPMFFV